MTIPVTQSLPNAPDFSPAVMSKTAGSGTASLFDALLAALDVVGEAQPNSGADAAAPAESFPWPATDTDDVPSPTMIDDDTASSVDGLPPNLDASLPLPLPQQSEIAQPVPAKPASAAGLDAPPVKNSALRVLAANAYAEAAALNEPEIPDAAPAAEPATPHIPALAQPTSDSKVFKAANEQSALQTDQPATAGNETAKSPVAVTDGGPAQATALVSDSARAPAPRSEEPDDSAQSDDSTQSNNLPNPNAIADDIAKAVANTTANQPAPAPQPPVAAILAATEAQPLVAGTSATASDNPPQASAKVGTTQAKAAIASNGDAKGANAGRQTTQNASFEKIETVDQPKTQEAAHTPAPPPRAENEPVPAAANAVPQIAAAPLPHHASIDTAPPTFSISGIAAPNAALTNGAIHFEVTALANTAADMGALALRIAAKSSAGESEFTVQLDPPDLGRIEVQLNVNSQGSAQANLIADKPQTLDLLQRDAPMLERALKDAGLDLAGGLSFSLKSDGQPGDWRNSPSSGQERAPRIEMVDGPGPNTATIPSASLIAADWAAGTMRLDIRI